MEITEFLAARMDEDEAVARAALHTPESEWSWSSVDYNSPVAEDHGLRWKPERVLADLAAKRRLVELCATWITEGERVADGRDMSALLVRTQGITAETVLRALAQSYAGHPDHNPDWRP